MSLWCYYTCDLQHCFMGRCLDENLACPQFKNVQHGIWFSLIPLQNFITASHRCSAKKNSHPQIGSSENKVPQNLMVAHHFPYLNWHHFLVIISLAACIISHSHPKTTAGFSVHVFTGKSHAIPRKTPMFQSTTPTLMVDSSFLGQSTKTRVPFFISYGLFHFLVYVPRTLLMLLHFSTCSSKPYLYIQKYTHCWCWNLFMSCWNLHASCWKSSFIVLNHPSIPISSPFNQFNPNGS
jgi:hypothetical protein